MTSPKGGNFAAIPSPKGRSQVFLASLKRDETGRLKVLLHIPALLAKARKGGREEHRLEWWASQGVLHFSGFFED